MSAFEVTIHPRQRPSTGAAALSSIPGVAMSSIPVSPAMSSLPTAPAMSSIPAPSGAARELSPLSGRRR